MIHPSLRPDGKDHIPTLDQLVDKMDELNEGEEEITGYMKQLGDDPQDQLAHRMNEIQLETIRGLRDHVRLIADIQVRRLENCLLTVARSTDHSTLQEDENS